MFRSRYNERLAQYEVWDDAFPNNPLVAACDTKLDLYSFMLNVCNNPSAYTCQFSRKDKLFRELVLGAC